MGAPVTTDPTDVHGWTDTILRGILQALEGGGVVDSSGGAAFPGRYDNTLTYNPDGTVATISFTDTVNTWTQTFTYTTGNLTGLSKWVKS